MERWKNVVGDGPCRSRFWWKTLENYSFPFADRPIALTVLLIVILFVGIVANTITCMVITKNKSMHTPFNYYLFSLAISDMLLLTSHITYQLLRMWTPIIYGNNVFIFVWCILFMISINMASNASIFTIIAFTVERYFVICHPFKTKSELSEIVSYIRRIWVIALLTAFPLCAACLCGTSAGPCYFYLFIVVIYTLLLFVIPLLLITVLYILIGLKLRKHKEGMNLRRSTSPDDSRIIKMLVAVVVAFFICWAPFWLLRILLLNNNLSCDLDNQFFSALTIIGLVLYYISTIINPVIYNLMSTKFRKAFQETLGDNLKLSRIMRCCQWIQDNVWQGCYQVQLHTTTTTTTKWSLHNIYRIESHTNTSTTEMTSCSSE